MYEREYVVLLCLSLTYLAQQNKWRIISLSHPISSYQTLSRDMDEYFICHFGPWAGILGFIVCLVPDFFYYYLTTLNLKNKV